MSKEASGGPSCCSYEPAFRARAAPVALREYETMAELFSRQLHTMLHHVCAHRYPRQHRPALGFRFVKAGSVF